MEIIELKSYIELPILNRKTICSIGFFDGVHLGHQKLIKQLVKDAKQNEMSSLLITFDDALIEKFKKSTPLNQQTLKLKAFEQLNVDIVIIIKNHSDLLNLTGDEFIRHVLKRCNVNKIYCGEDFFFGKDFKKGQDLEKEFIVKEMKSVKFEHEKISSSFIKKLLQEGKIQLANTFLYYPYTLIKKVIHGREIGRTISFKTANLAIKQNILLKNGVYFGKAYYQNQEYKAMINIGNNPTVSQDSLKKVEVHLIDFDKEIYGQTLKVVFEYYYREEIKFMSIEALKMQLEKDKKQLIERN